jgi:hypothetical protein
MIINNTNTALSTIPSNGNDFQVEVSAKMFEILATKIYERPVDAVVRELVCNAVDAHIAAGKREVPIRVSLPTEIIPFFSVTDYGIGMSHDDVTSIYSVAFKSTKDQSNDPIGSFGIGKFSAFSVSDTFELISIKDGVENHYIAVFNKGGNELPRIDRIMSNKTDKQNGTTVRVPVPSNMFHRFVSSASYYLSYMDVYPEVNMPLNRHISEEKMALLNEFGWVKNGNDTTVIISGVPYSCNKSLLKLDPFIGDAFRGGIIFKANNGDLTIAPSRETLSITKKDEEKLAEIGKKISDNFVESLHKAVEGMKRREAFFHLYEDMDIPLACIPVDYKKGIVAKGGYSSCYFPPRSPNCVSTRWGSDGFKYLKPTIVYNDTKRRMLDRIHKKAKKPFLTIKFNENVKKRIEQWFGYEVNWVAYSTLYDQYTEKKVKASTHLNGSDTKKNIITATTEFGRQVIDLNSVTDVYYIEGCFATPYLNIGSGKSWGDVSYLLNKLVESGIIKTKPVTFRMEPRHEKVIERLGIKNIKSLLEEADKKALDMISKFPDDVEIFTKIHNLTQLEQIKHTITPLSYITNEKSSKMLMLLGNLDILPSIVARQNHESCLRDGRRTVSAKEVNEKYPLLGYTRYFDNETEKFDNLVKYVRMVDEYEQLKTKLGE